MRVRGAFPPRGLAVAALWVVLAAAMGCASAAAPSRQAAVLPGKPACFFMANLYGWTVLDDSTLIVRIPHSQRAYLLKLFEPIIGLRFHERLGFQDTEHTGQICNGSLDNLVVRGIAQPPDPIIAVRQITPATQRRLLQAAGQKVPRDVLNETTRESVAN